MCYNAGSWSIYATRSLLQTSLPGQQPHSLFVPLSQDKSLETGPFPLELSWFFRSCWASSFPCSGKSSYRGSNDPNCSVPSGQSKCALVRDASMYRIPVRPDFSEVLDNSAQSQWVPRWLSIPRHMGNRSTTAEGTDWTTEPHSVPSRI